jgi:drug/metabolite transporter (DMT)-like permease
MAGYFYIAGTLILTVYGQLILKWRMNSLGSLPAGSIPKVKFLFLALADPYILSGFASAFIASLFWMAAMTKFEITKAYPFMSLAPAIVFILGVFLLNETFTWGKIIGLLLIVLGIIVTVKY